jgi:hypothetical protein
MRKIEMEMQTAIRNRKDWQKANTSVDFDQEGFMTVRLHGNRICEKDFEWFIDGQSFFDGYKIIR